MLNWHRRACVVHQAMAFRAPVSDLTFIEMRTMSLGITKGSEALQVCHCHGVSILSADRPLIPYRSEFVETYHEWMKDEFNLEMTASEPLSLEEEYKMQESWRVDDKK